MKDTRVYFPIEVKKRDLIARIAFAIKCSQKDLAVVIGDKASVLGDDMICKMEFIF